MKKLITIALLLPLFAMAQNPEPKDTLWRTEGSISFNFSQVALSNWSAGGKSSMSGVGMFSYKANYKKEKLSWDNTIDMRYGFIKEGSDDLRKSDDNIDISSKLGIEARNNWHYALLLNFKSQFSEGINYDDPDEKVISKFMSPGYLNLGAGIDYKKDNFSVYLTPANGKFTFVTDDVLSAEGAFGVDPGKKSRAELGAMAKVEYKTEIMKNVTFDTKLDLFTNYIENFGNIDIDWTGKINMKVNDILSANLLVHLIYDDDIAIEDPDTGKSGPKVQLMESFGAGLTLSF